MNMQKLMFIVAEDIAFANALLRSTEQIAVGIHLTPSGDVVSMAQHHAPSLIVLDFAQSSSRVLQVYETLLASSLLAQTRLLLLSSPLDRPDLRCFQDPLQSSSLGPLRAEEIAAHIEASLPRSRPVQTDPRIRVGALEIDIAAMTVHRDGKPVMLTNTEYRILEHLVRHPGTPFTRQEILAAVWPTCRIATPRSVDSHIWRLREKVERVPKHPTYIQTIQGQGYCLAVCEEPESHPELDMNRRLA